VHTLGPCRLSSLYRTNLPVIKKNHVMFNNLDVTGLLGNSVFEYFPYLLVVMSPSFA
jgi:hypothetical protein